MSVDLIVSVNAGWCGRDFIVPLEDLQEYQSDPETFEARLLGLTRPEHVAFLLDGGSLTCGATTKSGSRCKNIIAACLEPEQWKELKGKECFCWHHGGDTRRNTVSTLGIET